MAKMPDIVTLLIVNLYGVYGFQREGYYCNSTYDSTVERFFMGMVCELTKENRIMYFFAGFMTASLIFSVCCFMTKCGACKKKNTINKDTELQQANAPLDDQPAHDQPADGHSADPARDRATIDYDKKIYTYCEYDNNDIPSSSKHHHVFNRQSYDLIDHNRANSTVLANSDVANLYNHVTLEMGESAYDMSSHVKPRIEANDPTYSHITEVKMANDEENGNICDQTKKKEKKKKNDHKKRNKGKSKPKKVPESSSKLQIPKPIETQDGNKLSNNQDKTRNTNIKETSKEDFEIAQTDQIIENETFLNGLENEKEAKIERREQSNATEIDEENGTTEKCICDQTKKKEKEKKTEHKKRIEGNSKPTEVTESSFKLQIPKAIETQDGNKSLNNQDKMSRTNIIEDSKEDFETAQTDQIIENDTFFNGLENEEEAKIERREQSNATEIENETSCSTIIDETSNIQKTVSGFTNDQNEALIKEEEEREDVISRRTNADQTGSVDVKESDGNNYYLISPVFCDSNDNHSLEKSTVGLNPVDNDSTFGQYGMCDDLEIKDNDFPPSEDTQVKEKRKIETAVERDHEELTDINTELDFENNHEEDKESTSSTVSSSKLAGVDEIYSNEIFINSLYEQVSIEGDKIFIGDVDASLLRSNDEMNSLE